MALALLWFVGFNLRTVLLGVPPSLPALHRSLALSYATAGLLSAVPVLVLGLVAIPGALVVGRLGARQTVAIGLALLAGGAALRSAVPAAISLFMFTVVMAVGIAITQPALPALVQRWFPDRVGRATGIYSNGLFVGEVIAAVITLPILLEGLGLGWQGALAAWAIPALVCLVAWLLFAPEARPVDTGEVLRWLPDIRSGRAWRMGLLMGGASLIYFGMNTWIPDTLAVRGSRGMTTATLGLLNLMQLPVSAALAVIGDALVGRRWPYVAAGMMSAVGVLGYVFGPPASAPIWGGLLGGASSLIFILNLGLPPLTAAPHEVAGVTAFMLATGYASAFFGPALGGLAWDASGIWQLALAPIGLACLTTIVLGATLPRPRFGEARPEAFRSA